MAEPTTTSITALLAGFTALLGWLGHRQVARLDSLERKETISRAEHTEQLAAIYAKIDRNQQAIIQRIDELIARGHR